MKFFDNIWASAFLWSDDHYGFLNSQYATSIVAISQVGLTFLIGTTIKRIFSLNLTLSDTVIYIIIVAVIIAYYSILAYIYSKRGPQLVETFQDKPQREKRIWLAVSICSFFFCQSSSAGSLKKFRERPS
jgi:magnesium-transporting ATPase (P-type)